MFSGRAGRASVAVAIAAVTLATSPAAAQTSAEGRIDGLIARRSAIQAGAGLSTHLGTYIRGFVGAGAGPDTGSDMTWRLDAALRYHLDPFRESDWAPYAGGGISYVRSDGDARPWLLLVIGVEGPPRRGVAPAFELGAGGGARIGFALRAAKRNRR